MITPAALPLSSGAPENVTAARIARASRLISVCEKTVPATTASMRARGPSMWRVITTTRVGSPMRPGNTAEAITPIIVARTTGGQRITLSGRAARSTCCQETERSPSERAISSSESAIQPGLAVIRAWPARLRFSRESANATRPASATASSAIPILRRWPRRSLRLVGPRRWPSGGV